MSVVLRDQVHERDGLLVAQVDRSSYAQQWQDEATTDHVRSAIAVPAGAPHDLETLTGKINPLWARFPQDRRIGTLLDIGSGYGRIDLWLGHQKGLRCDTFCAVDISAAMLERLLEYRRRFDLFPGAAVHPILSSADSLPIADESVDLVVSSAVFLHMGKPYVAQTLREVARVLKPEGHFVFDTSFPNALNPWSYVPRLKPHSRRAPHHLKYWRGQEVRNAIDNSGLGARVGSYHVEGTLFALVPKEIGPVLIPLAGRINAAVADPAHFRDFLTVTYSAYSDGALV